MQPLSSAALLNAWEQGQNRSPAYRALLLLSAAFPDIPPEQLAAWSLGRRDAALLTLREQMFGPRLSGIADCPKCGERLEMEFDTSDLRTEPEPADSEFALTLDNRTLRFRMPNSLDLLEVLDPARSDTAIRQTRSALLQRCLLDTGLDSNETPDEATIAAIESAMAQADPQADLQLELTCPVCNHLWEIAFDIAGYLWAEIDNRARRLLRDVHRLASAYNWSEADILALSPQRRTIYLSLLES